MKKFKIKNYGMKNINWLINEFKEKEVTVKNIQKLKDDVFDSFINTPMIDFSTKGGVSVTLLDFRDMSNCEIIYDA